MYVHYVHLHVHMYMYMYMLSCVTCKDTCSYQLCYNSDTSNSLSTDKEMGYDNTVEPPFNGQFGDFYFVLYTEVSFTRRFSSSGTGNANLRLYKTQNCFREDVLRNPQM